MKEKISILILKIKEKLSPTLTKLDETFAGLIPNIKLRKLLYITIGGLFSILFLIIFIGIITLPFRQRLVDDQGFTLNKPVVKPVATPSSVEMNETQKELLRLENNIRDLNFPESKLTVPSVKLDIIITNDD